MTGLFNQETIPVIDPNKNYLEELVGDGKKFKSPEDLARGKAEADAYIERLHREAEGIRAELNTRMTLEQYMEKMTSNPGTQPNFNTQPDPNTNGSGDGKGSQFTPEQIEEIVTRTVSQREQERIQKQNLVSVQAELSQAYGNDYVTKLKEVAQGLGLDQQFLDGLAKTQPKAFLKLVGVEGREKTQTQSGLFTPPQTQQSNSFAPNTAVRNMKYYEDLRKKDPANYWSPGVQNQMHKDAMDLEENFYN